MALTVTKMLLSTLLEALIADQFGLALQRLYHETAISFLLSAVSNRDHLDTED